MDFDLQTAVALLLLAVMASFAFGWMASRFDLQQWKREQRESSKAYVQGLILLLNEQQDKAIDAFIAAVQQDPGSSDLHFALGNMFRRRGDYERAVRVHEHLLGRGDLSQAERERAQHALALDYVKAGLFDRAEAAFRTLEGSSFSTDARLELLNLQERSRNWHAAIDTAQKLEASGAGSFATRIAHYHCALALEADAQHRSQEADAALRKARDAAPLAARPLVLEGERHAQAGRHADALAAWNGLLATQPGAFVLVARAYAASALACHDLQAPAQLQALYERSPSADLLEARLLLVGDGATRLQLVREHLQQHPGPTAAAALLKELLAQQQAPSAADTDQLQRLASAAAKPVRRYRCAACGFEAQHYFWQCPGCQTWDSYPTQRLEDQ